MAKYGPKAQALVAQEMQEMKEGKLRSGSGAKVTNPKQAIAIALSEARRAGAKMPPPPEGTAAAEKETAKEGSRAGKKASKRVGAKDKGVAAKKVPAKKAVKPAVKPKMPAAKKIVKAAG